MKSVWKAVTGTRTRKRARTIYHFAVFIPRSD